MSTQLQLKKERSELKKQKQTVLQERTALEQHNSIINQKHSNLMMSLADMANQQTKLNPDDDRYNKKFKFYKDNINNYEEALQKLLDTITDNDKRITNLILDEGKLSTTIDNKNMLIRKLGNPLFTTIKNKLTCTSNQCGKGKIIKTNKYKFKIKKNKTINKKNKKFIKKSKKYRIKRKF